MNIPCKTYQDAVRIALEKSSVDLAKKWYINRLASSGPMRYEVSTRAITDTSFGGACVAFVINNELHG